MVVLLHVVIVKNNAANPDCDSVYALYTEFLCRQTIEKNI